MNIKIAILSSYNIKNIGPTLRKNIEKIGLQTELIFGEYNQYIQELINPESRINKEKPDIIILALSTTTVFPNIYNQIEKETNKTQETGQLSQFITQQCSAINAAIEQQIAIRATMPEILITTLETPWYSPLGIQETNQKNTTTTIHKTVNEFNQKLSEIAHKQPFITLLDFEKIASYIGKKQLTDQKMFYLGKILLSSEAAKEFALEITRHVIAKYNLTKKCLIVDLDNTLWGGVVGEDGPTGVHIGEAGIGSIYKDIQKTILHIKNKGILLAICSKNNKADTKEILAKHPEMILKEEDFITTRINWENKSTNIQSIAKELNIGLNSIVFLDDNPAERLEVATRLPEVAVLEFPEDPALVPTLLQRTIYFESKQLTEEDKKRSQLYKERKQRQELEKTFTNVEEYLQKLEIKVHIKHNDEEQLPRITQLINKTNQFNLRTQRYTQEEVEHMMKSEEFHIFSISVQDKFGEMGLTGVLIFKEKETEYFIDSFLMSCRILSRNIEKKFFSEAVKKLDKNKICKAEYIKTAKNKPAEKIYEELGFTKAADTEQKKTYNLELKTYTPEKIKYIEVLHEE